MELLKNYFISAIRTAVPLLVGALANIINLHFGIDVTGDSLVILTLAIEGVFGMAYYLVVRALEHVNHRFGWLLGYAKMPDYTPGGALADQPTAQVGK